MSTENDKWASLAAELGLAESTRKDAPAEEAAPVKRGRGRPRRTSAPKRPVEKVATTADTEEVMEDAVITEDAPMTDEEALTKKRRRRRSRKKKGTGEGEPTSNNDSNDVVYDDDESTDLPLVDWKMPTWHELIDSLHRP